MTSDELAAVAGVVLSLAFSYVPGLQVVTEGATQKVAKQAEAQAAEEKDSCQ